MAVVTAVAGTALVVWPGLEGYDSFAVPKQQVLAMMAALVLFAAAAGAGATLAREPVYLALLGYAGCALASAAAAGGSTIWNASSVAAELSWLVMFAATRALAAGDGRAAERLTVAVVVTSALVAVVAMLEALGVGLPWSGPRRPLSTLGNRNAVGGLLAIATPLAVLLALRRTTPVRLAVVALLVAVVVLTRCRSAWLGLAVAAAGGAGLALVRGRRARAPRRALLAIAGAVCFGAVVAVAVPWPGLSWAEASPFATSASRLVDAGGGSGKVRVDQHRVGAAAIAQHPILGGGPNGWGNAASRHAHAAPHMHAQPWYGATTPNSDLLRTAVEYGVPAAVCLLVAVVLIARRAARAADVPTAACLLGALVVAAVHGALDAPLYRVETAVVLAVVAALAMGPPRAPTVALPRWPVRAGLAALALALAAGSVARTSAAVTLASATEIADLERSYRRYPRPEVGHRIVERAARLRRCGPIDAAAPRLLEATPHHWGLLRAAGGCAEARGDRAAAAALYRRAIAIEPHLSLLRADLARVSGGADR